MPTQQTTMAPGETQGHQTQPSQAAAIVSAIPYTVRRPRRIWHETHTEILSRHLGTWVEPLTGEEWESAQWQALLDLAVTP